MFTSISTAVSLQLERIHDVELVSVSVAFKLGSNGERPKEIEREGVRDV